MNQFRSLSYLPNNVERRFIHHFVETRYQSADLGHQFFEYLRATDLIELSAAFDAEKLPGRFRSFFIRKHRLKKFLELIQRIGVHETRGLSPIGGLSRSDKGFRHSFRRILIRLS